VSFAKISSTFEISVLSDKIGSAIFVDVHDDYQAAATQDAGGVSGGGPHGRAS